MSVTSGNIEIDDLLIRALARDRVSWALGEDSRTIAAVLKAIDYHGVAGLLHEGMDETWPRSACAGISERAVGQAMWELRHKVILSAVLETFADRSLPTLLLKGTAMAYDLYDHPAQRARGDTDVLVREEDLPAVRQVLTEADFRSDGEEYVPEKLRAQESWLRLADDGSAHSIDLHWRVLNAPALYAAFPFEALWTSRRALKRLSRAAFAPSRPTLVAHACVHRALHDCSPYYVGGDAHFGGNRLIWLWDILLLGRSLTPPEWEEVVALAKSGALGDVIVDGLMAAQARFGSFCPAHVQERLRRAGPNRYFRRGQLGRAAMDWWAVQGPQRKAQYALAKLLPSRQFMQAKYPSERDKPLPLLYLRRVRELIRPRPTGANAG